FGNGKSIERNTMCHIVLGADSWQLPHRTVEIDLRPVHIRHLFATGHRAEKQPDVGAPKRTKFDAGLPDSNNLFGRQDAPAGGYRFWCLHPINWRPIEVAPVHRPVEELAKG